MRLTDGEKKKYEVILMDVDGTLLDFDRAEAGSQKPQREFFDYCFKKIPGADPGKMLLIGDSLTSDMLGGVNAGVDTCWYNPHRGKNRKNVPVTFEITSLEEIRAIL